MSDDSKLMKVKAEVKSEASEDNNEVSDVHILGSALEYVEDPKLGQKKPTPSPGSGIRVFYETLVRVNEMQEAIMNL